MCFVFNYESNNIVVQFLLYLNRKLYQDIYCLIRCDFEFHYKDNQTLMKYPQNKYRQKLLEAIVFFSQKGKIRNPSKMMIFKLLAEIDFRHFEETGLPITNLKHNAYPKGPVADSFFNEITEGKDIVLPKDFEDSVSITKTQFEDENGKLHEGFKFIAKRKPNLDIFSPRQIKIMDDVAFIYKIATATEASKASHEPGKPWTKTVESKGKGAIIDYIEVIPVKKPLTIEIAKEMMRERDALIYNYGG